MPTMHHDLRDKPNTPPIPTPLRRRLQEASQSSQRNSNTLLDMQARRTTRRPLDSRPPRSRQPCLSTPTSAQILQQQSWQPHLA